MGGLILKIEVFERVQTENLDMVKFVLDGVSVELANAFRRMILTEVPTMAINEVLFVENDTVLYDEMIAHRLGLIPLTTDLKNYNLPEECSCGGQGCTLCQAQLMCEVHAENEQISVYSRDLESLDPKIHPVNENYLIAKLGKRTSLVFEAFAQLGRGKDHAKFQPVCSIGYKYFPKITIDNSKFKDESEIDEFLLKDHTKSFKKEDRKLVLVKDYWKGPDFTDSIAHHAPPGAIKFDFESNKFVFTVEGTGSLPLKEVFSKAIEIFIEKLDEFEEQLKSVEIEPIIPKVSMRKL
ncbi:MAG: DNA-directed RNA polymerase subunit D [Promethearchaeia archaeon]|nr:MAG: DNA-directed RNA polymerase subunit D [Candidatus Lokiarchaeia archaeon]